MWQSLNSLQKRSFLALLGTTLCYSMVLGHFFFQPRLVHALGGSATDAASLSALSLVPVLLMAAWGHQWLASWKASCVLRIGLALTTLGFAAYAIVPTLALMIPISLLNGFGYALTFSRLMVAATSAVPRAYYATSVAYVTVAMQMGNSLGSLSASLLEPHVGIHHLFWPSVAAGLLAQLMIGKIKQTPAAPTASADATVARKPNVARGEIARILVLFGALGLAFNMPLQFVPLWLASMPVHSPLAGSSPGYFVTTALIAIMLSRLVFGKQLQQEHQDRLVGICFAVLGVALICLGFASSPWLLILVAAIYGSSYSLLYPSGTAYFLQRGSEAERAQRSTWLMLGFELGGRLLPLLFALIADRQGFAMAFHLLAMAVGAIGIWHVADRLEVRRLQNAA